MSFFDKETNTGEVVGRMSGDTFLIKDAMGEKVSMNHPSYYLKSPPFCFFQLPKKKSLSSLLSTLRSFQVGQFIQFVATFIGAFVISFTKGWLLTVVMLSSIPLVVLSGAMMSMVIAKASSTGQAAYSKSASVVEQTIGSIRTVSTLAKNNIETLFYFVIT